MEKEEEQKKMEKEDEKRKTEKEEEAKRGEKQKTKRQYSLPKIFGSSPTTEGEKKPEKLRGKRERFNSYHGQKRVSFENPDQISDIQRKRLQSLCERKQRLGSVSENGAFENVDLSDTVVGQRRRLDSIGGNKLRKLFENPFG